MQTPGLPVDAGVAVGAVAGGLLVAVEDELGRRLIELVEHRQDRAAGVAEHVSTLCVADQHLVEDLGAGLALVLGLSWWRPWWFR